MCEKKFLYQLLAYFQNVLYPIIPAKSARLINRALWCRVTHSPSSVPKTLTMASARCHELVAKRETTSKTSNKIYLNVSSVSLNSMLCLMTNVTQMQNKTIVSTTGCPIKTVNEATHTILSATILEKSLIHGQAIKYTCNADFSFLGGKETTTICNDGNYNVEPGVCYRSK